MTIPIILGVLCAGLAFMFWCLARVAAQSDRQLFLAEIADLKRRGLIEVREGQPHLTELGRAVAQEITQEDKSCR